MLPKNHNTKQSDPELGSFLRDRRGRLDPASFGFTKRRRRTPGLSREEVAELANISVIWYTWLEQGRGSKPSADVLERVCRALVLSDAEREYVFMLGRNRPPATRSHQNDELMPQLQLFMDSLRFSPAYVRTAAWDVVAWNRAATAVMRDFSKLPPDHRNILWLLFCDMDSRNKIPEWEKRVRRTVAAFRHETVCAGEFDRAEALVKDLTERCPDFRPIWDSNEVHSYELGRREMVHPKAGPLSLQHMSFSVDPARSLRLIVYTPTSSKDSDKIKGLLSQM